jgi:hypothetical protein
VVVETGRLEETNAVKLNPFTTYNGVLTTKVNYAELLYTSFWAPVRVMEVEKEQMEGEVAEPPAQV